MWFSLGISANKVKRLVHSAFAAETLSCTDALSDAVYCRQLVSEILYNRQKVGLLRSLDLWTTCSCLIRFPVQSSVQIRGFAWKFRAFHGLLQLICLRTVWPSVVQTLASWLKLWKRDFVMLSRSVNVMIIIYFYSWNLYDVLLCIIMLLLLTIYE